MKERKQKISQDTLQVADRTETDSKFGGQTFIGITENNFTNNEQRYGLLEMILSPINLNKAYKKVKYNKGSGGVDGLSVDDYFHTCLNTRRV